MSSEREKFQQTCLHPYPNIGNTAKMYMYLYILVCVYTVSSNNLHTLQKKKEKDTSIFLTPESYLWPLHLQEVLRMEAMWTANDCLGSAGYLNTC